MASILAMWSGGGYIESFPNAALKFSPVDNKTLKKLNILIDRTLIPRGFLLFLLLCLFLVIKCPFSSKMMLARDRIFKIFPY